MEDNRNMTVYPTKYNEHNQEPYHDQTIGLTKLEKLAMDIFLSKVTFVSVDTLDIEYYEKAAISSIEQANIFFDVLEKSKK